MGIAENIDRDGEPYELGRSVFFSGGGEPRNLEEKISDVDSIASAIKA